MPEPIKLLTFPKPKYGEQIVAVDRGPGKLNVALFDAVELFDGDKAAAKEWAERFVAQMNSAATETVR